MIIVDWLKLRLEQNAIMQKYEVSRAYVQELMQVNRAYLRDEVSITEWMVRVRAIQDRYPDDFALVGDAGLSWGVSYATRIASGKD